MPQFKYTAKNTAGKTIEGVIEAPIQRHAADKLKSQRFTIMTLSEMKAGEGGFLDKINIFKPGVKSKDLVIFSRQLVRSFQPASRLCRD